MLAEVVGALWWWQVLPTNCKFRMREACIADNFIVMSHPENILISWSNAINITTSLVDGHQ